MAGKQWNLQIDGQPWAIAFEHSTLTDKRSLQVNGEKIKPTKGSGNLFDAGAEVHFPVGSHACVVLIKTGGMTAAYELVIDGVSAETGQPVDVAAVAAAQAGLPPAWAWIFICACLAVPMITLGGLIPMVVGGGGAGACYGAAKSTDMGLGSRVGICTAITAGCWAILVVMLFVFAAVK